MVRLLDLGKSVVDAEKISFIGGIDTRVQHDTGKSHVIFFVNIVVDGNLITIHDHNKDEVVRIRELLVTEATPRIPVSN